MGSQVAVAAKLDFRPGGPGWRPSCHCHTVPWPMQLISSVDDSGQLSSAGPTPVPARPSPGDSAGGGSSPGTYSLALAVSGVARGGLGRRQRIQV